MRAGATISNATRTDVYICQRMEPLRKSYSVTLTYIFELNKYKLSSSCTCRFAYTCTTPAVELFLFALISLAFTTGLRACRTALNMNSARMWSAKAFGTCDEFGGQDSSECSITKAVSSTAIGRCTATTTVDAPDRRTPPVASFSPSTDLP